MGVGTGGAVPKLHANAVPISSNTPNQESSLMRVTHPPSKHANQAKKKPVIPPLVQFGVSRVSAVPAFSEEMTG